MAPQESAFLNAVESGEAIKVTQVIDGLLNHKLTIFFMYT